jgi:hypothetical protein
MQCEEAKLKLNAMIDNEIDEKDVPAMISHLESCYRCRTDYIGLLNLQKKMKGIKIPEPSKEWFETFTHRLFRRWTGFAGRLFFFGSYIVLLGYALYGFFIDTGPGLLQKLVIGGIVLGLLLLLGVAISDRIKESRTDRYKGVIK